MVVLLEVLKTSVTLKLPSAAFIPLGLSAPVLLADVLLSRSTVVRLCGCRGLRGGATADPCWSQNLLLGLSKALALLLQPVDFFFFLMMPAGACPLSMLLVVVPLRGELLLVLDVAWMPCGPFLLLVCFWMWWPSVRCSAPPFAVAFFGPPGDPVPCCLPGVWFWLVALWPLG